MEAPASAILLDLFLPLVEVAGRVISKKPREELPPRLRAYSGWHPAGFRRSSRARLDILEALVVHPELRKEVSSVWMRSHPFPEAGEEAMAFLERGYEAGVPPSSLAGSLFLSDSPGKDLALALVVAGLAGMRAGGEGSSTRHLEEMRQRLESAENRARQAAELERELERSSREAEKARRQASKARQEAALARERAVRAEEGLAQRERELATMTDELAAATEARKALEREVDELRRALEETRREVGSPHPPLIGAGREGLSGAAEALDEAGRAAGALATALARAAELLRGPMGSSEGPAPAGPASARGSPPDLLRDESRTLGTEEGRPLRVTGASRGARGRRQAVTAPRGLPLDTPEGVREALRGSRGTFLVDGYNVCLRLRGEGRGLAERREELVGALARAQGGSGPRVVVVFDGREGERNAGPARAGVLSLFTREGESADDYILELVRSEAGPFVVFSSDHALQRKAKEEGADVVAAEVLIQALKL